MYYVMSKNDITKGYCQTRAFWDKDTFSGPTKEVFTKENN